ncbi:MAG: hypothetical protein V5A16_06890 [Haloplanus sp.]
MASSTKQPVTADGEYAQMFPDWVYRIPGVVLMTLGFGGILFLTFV